MANNKIGTIRMRMGTHDAHYGGNLVDGARLIGLISDAGTELLIAWSGDEGLLAAWHHIEQFVPVYMGDYIEVRTWFSRYGNTSADLEGAVYKVGELVDGGKTNAARIIDPPILVMRASATGVTPKDVNRGLQVEKLEDIPFEPAGETKWWEKKRQK